MAAPHVRIPRRYLTTQQVAQIFGVSQITVGNWIRWGLLPFMRGGDKGWYYIDPDVLPTFDPPRTSPAWFNRELYDAMVGEG